MCVTLSVRGEVGQNEEGERVRQRESCVRGEAPVVPVAVFVVGGGGGEGRENGEETLASLSTALTSGR